MFGKAFKIGTLLGFRLEISFTFLILLGLYMLMTGVVGGLIIVTLVFGSVLLHELGHAVVARRLGMPIIAIELHFFGGAAKMAGPPRTAKDEIVIALAGPLVSFGVGAAAMALWLSTGWGPAKILAFINLMLGGFNLLPALPMDGGRVLRAALSKRIGRYKATHAAASVAQVIAVLFVVLAIVIKLWMLIALAVLLWFMASQERRMAGMWRYDDEPPEAEVLDEHGNVIFRPETQVGNGPVFTAASHHAVPGGSGGGPRRRVYRLPNGTVLVVEESIRW